MLPRVQVIVAALLFSTGGLCIKWTDLDAWQVSGGRSMVAALVFAVVLRVRPRSVSWGSVVAGVAYAATMVGFVVANKLTTAANTIFLQSTAPLYVVFLAPLLLGEVRRRQDAPIVLVVGLGLGLFFVGTDPAFVTAPNPALGNLIAAADGVFWALTLLSLRWLSTDASAALPGALVVGNLLAALASLPFAFPVEVSAMDFAVVVYLGAFQIGVAYLFMIAGMRSLTALEASMLLLIEPVLSAVWAWMAFGERPGAWSMIGCVLILTGALGKSALDARSRGAIGETREVV